MVMPWQCKCGHWNSDADMYCENCQPELWEKNHWTKSLHKEVKRKLAPMRKIIFKENEDG